MITGGPAFPCPANLEDFEGMTLRDWFAGMAMQGMLSCDDNYETCRRNAESAYAHADAMLAARQEDQK